MHTRLRSLRLSTLAAVLPLLAIACPSTPRDPVGCGAGTELRDGVCIALPPVDDARCGEGTVENPELGICEPLVDCGEGTVRDGDDCRPIAVCGEGTFYDRPSRSCVAEARCSPGTVANTETRTCESPIVCGPGTVLDTASRECRPLPACTPGTVLDEDSGLCVGAVECGDDQVVINGQCVEPNDAVALEADASEGPGENDPALGGTAEAIVLEAIGERAVFVGGIDRPQDLDGDGVVDQDRDAWSFDAVAGDYLAIELKSLGLTGPAFLIDGPRGYQRASTVGFEVEPRRELLVPYTGRYTITVVPGSFLTTGVPAGGLDGGYVGIVERRERPALVDVIPGATGIEPTILTGNLLGLDDNFFAVDAAPGSAVVVTFRGVPTETAPALIAMSNDNALLADVHELGEGEWVGIFTPAGDQAGDDAFFVVDWRESFGPADDYSIEVNLVPLVDAGTLPNDASAQTAGVDILSGQTAAYRFAVPLPQLMELDILQTTSPDVQITDDNGTFSIIDDDDLFFFFAAAGSYVVFVNNDATGDDLDAALALSLLTPAPIGVLDFDGNATGTMTGPDLVDTVEGPSEAWGVVEVPGDSTLALDAIVGAGDPDLLLFTAQGTPLRGLARPQARGALHIINELPRTILVKLEAAGTTCVDWRLDARLLPTPAVLELEPNDSIDRATILPGAPSIVRGTVRHLESDLYRLELPAELAAGQALQIAYDDLGIANGSGSITEGASVMIYDGGLQPLASVPFNLATLGPDAVPFEEGLLGSNTRTFVGHFEGPGPFFIKIVRRFAPPASATSSDYLLAVDIVDAQVEVEPNDDPGNADVVALDSRIVGYRTNSDPADVYRFTLPTALSPAERLRVRFDNLETNNAFTVELRDAADTVTLARSVRVLGAVVASDLAAGDYVLRVSGGGNLEPPYAFTITVDDRAFEVEPNDVLDIAVATDLGTLDATQDEPLTIDAIRGTDDDVFAFALAAPLAAGESIRVDAHNTSDSTSLGLELYEVVGDVPTLRVSHAFDAAVVVATPTGSGPFFARVVGLAGTADPDHYRLRVSVAGRAEQEPNDTQVNATLLPTGDFVIDGVVTRASASSFDTDVMRLELAAPTTMTLRWQNLSDTTALRLSVREANFTTEIATASSASGQHTALSLPAGTIYLVLTVGATAASQDHWRLTGTVTP